MNSKINIVITNNKHGAEVSEFNEQKMKFFRFNIKKKKLSMIGFLVGFNKSDIVTNDSGEITVILDKDVDYKEGKQYAKEIIFEVFGEDRPLEIITGLIIQNQPTKTKKKKNNG